MSVFTQITQISAHKSHSTITRLIVEIQLDNHFLPACDKDININKPMNKKDPGKISHFHVLVGTRAVYRQQGSFNSREKTHLCVNTKTCFAKS